MQEKITFISGKLYYKIFLAGANKILENQKHLNQINVFPVPDADTGTNLASTLRSVIDNVTPHESFHQTANAIAIAALNGARGNSGVIFAQFLYGVSLENGENEKLSISHFAEVVKRSVQYVYEAIAEPVEGTMLTVIREWAEFIYSQKDKVDDFTSLLMHAYDIATHSLKETTEKLKVLKLSNVVDAGAKGFVLFLEGIMEGLRKKGGKREIVVNPIQAEPAAFKNISHEEMNYRYCTEALIKSAYIDKAQLRETVKDLGDSLVIAGSSEMVRLHLHTNQPHFLFEKLGHFGTLSYQKADDMKKQNDVFTNRKWNIALVTDSTCDLPDELLDTYQINVVPLNIHFGENQYLDRLTILPEQFFKLTDSQPDFPTTSQPNEAVFLNLYSHLSSHYDSVIAVHLSGKFSGTLNNSRSAAQRITKETGTKISVLDSHHVSGSLALLTLRVAKAIENGTAHDQIVKKFEQWRDNTRILVSVKNLKYMVRGGRVSPMKGTIASLMNIKPIVSVDQEGNSSLFDKAFTQKANMRKVMKHIDKFLSEKKPWNYIILHAEGSDTAEWFKDEMMKRTGREPLSIVNISPVIGLSAGKGTAAVALMAD